MKGAAAFMMGLHLILVLNMLAVLGLYWWPAWSHHRQHLHNLNHHNHHNHHQVATLAPQAQAAVPMMMEALAPPAQYTPEERFEQAARGAAACAQMKKGSFYTLGFDKEGRCCDYGPKVEEACKGSIWSMQPEGKMKTSHVRMRLLNEAGTQGSARGDFEFYSGKEEKKCKGKLEVAFTEDSAIVTLLKPIRC